MRRVLSLTFVLLACAFAVHSAPLKLADGSPLTPQLVINDGSTPCNKEDYPDSPAHAFRDAKGQIQMVLGNRFSRRIVGPDFDHLKRDCRIVFQGAENKDPTHHSYRGWIHATYTENGQIIYALIHNEFHGHRIFPECHNNYQRCWWNDVDWVTSVDGGQTYTSPAPDKRLVVGLAQSYKPNIGRPAGFMNPSSILEADGYLYSIVPAMAYDNQPDGNYLIRKSKKAAWSDWEIWNGKSYDSIAARIKAGGPVGEPLDLGLVDGFADKAPMKVHALVKHTPSGKYIALMTSKQPLAAAPQTDGFYIATSTDLIHWSPATQLVQANLRPLIECKGNPKAGPLEYYRYGNLIDPTSTDRNFQTVGNKAFLYTTRIAGQTCDQEPKNLQLIRVPVTLNIK